MHNTQNDVARNQCTKAPRVESRDTFTGFPTPLLFTSYVSAITVLPKVRLSKNKAADLSTQISFIS